MAHRDARTSNTWLAAAQFGLYKDPIKSRFHVLSVDDKPSTKAISNGPSPSTVHARAEEIVQTRLSLTARILRALLEMFRQPLDRTPRTRNPVRGPLHTDFRYMDRIKRTFTNAALGEADDFGQRYSIDFECGNGSRRAVVTSAWIVLKAEDFPRLLTCYVLSK